MKIKNQIDLTNLQQFKTSLISLLDNPAVRRPSQLCCLEAVYANGSLAILFICFLPLC